MSQPRDLAALFPSETDPEHILGRGFEISLSSGELRLVDPEVDAPPPIVLRSAWGRATRTSRKAWPYNFEPLLYSGSQLWIDRTLLVPPLLSSVMLATCLGPGAGAYVSLDEVPDPYDTMEFVFCRRTYPEAVPDEVCMAWVVLDTRITLDPFVVVAARVLEPLIAQLRAAIEQTRGEQVEVIGELTVHVDALPAAVRDLQAEPSRMRAVTGAALTALAAVVLNIIANRVDPLIDRIDWPAVYNAIKEVIRQLGVV